MMFQQQVYHRAQLNLHNKAGGAEDKDDDSEQEGKEDSEDNNTVSLSDVDEEDSNDDDSILLSDDAEDKEEEGDDMEEMEDKGSADSDKTVSDPDSDSPDLSELSDEVTPSKKQMTKEKKKEKKWYNGTKKKPLTLTPTSKQRFNGFIESGSKPNLSKNPKKKLPHSTYKAVLYSSNQNGREGEYLQKFNQKLDRVEKDFDITQVTLTKEKDTKSTIITYSFFSEKGAKLMEKWVSSVEVKDCHYFLMFEKRTGDKTKTYLNPEPKKKAKKEPKKETKKGTGSKKEITKGTQNKTLPVPAHMIKLKRVYLKETKMK